MGQGGNKGRKGREEGKRRGQRQGKAGRAHGIYMITQRVEIKTPKWTNDRSKTSEAEKGRARERQDRSERQRPKLQRCCHKKSIARVAKYTNIPTTTTAGSLPKRIDGRKE